MDIPYTVHARQDTGLYNAKLGVWLFLASEIMLFGGLFSSYVFLRMGASNWPQGSSILSVPIATFNTVVLITSSITVVLAWAGLAMKNFEQFRKYMRITILLGFTFLAVKTYEYNQKFHHGLYPSTSVFMGIYFTMTGLHVLHIIGGLVVNIYFLGPGSKMWKSDPDRFLNRIEVAGLYWHFVDLVWIFLFPVLYLL